MASEFNIIRDFFTRPTKHTDLSVGDDAALLRVQNGYQLAISTDMLVADTHFFANAAPYDIGWKALTVNVSDMAAMGAQPKWATLALALPHYLPSPSQGEGSIDAHWLREFTRGFFACADTFGIDLIGGDTTRGPLNISVTIFGEIPQGLALRRDGAKAGDDIWVSGYLGSAAAGLAHLQGKIELKNDALQASLDALHRPMPRVNLGLKLREIANSCIDISDGLAADLGHILENSKLGAEIYYESIPKHPALQAKLGAAFESMVLSGGDDYELCFTTPPDKRDAIENIAKDLNLKLTRIGVTRKEPGLQVYDAQNNLMQIDSKGYDHFA